MSARRATGHLGRALAALLVARLVLGMAYSVANPLGEAPDEADHYAYAAYIGSEGRLPDGSWMTQAKHPPLYHLLAAGVAAWTGMDFQFLRSNPDVSLAPETTAHNFFIHTALEDWPWRDGALAMHLGRIVSVLAGVILTAATYALGRAIWPDWPGGALAGAIFVAFLPESLFIAGSMSNDTLAAALATLMLWAGLAGRPGSPRRGLAMAALSGLFGGLAFLTKVSTVALWPVAALAMFWQDYAGTGPQRRSPVRSLARPALSGAIVLALAAPWLWRNLQLYGDPLGMALMRATVDLRQGPLGAGDLFWLARGWFFSFWGKFGGAGHLPLPGWLYGFWAVLLGLSAAGWLRRALLRRRGDGRMPSPPGRTSPAGAMVLWGSPVMAILAILSYSEVALGTDQGRLLFPASGPLALLLVAGLAAWLPRRAGAAWQVAWAGLMGAAACLALVLGIVRPFAAPAPQATAQVAAAVPQNVTFGDRLQLLSASGDGEGDGGLTLYWQARQPITDDLRTVLRLLDGDGNLVWEWKRSPGAGRYSTDHWTPGRPVADTYTPPAEALARATRLEVGVFPFPDGAWLQPSGQPEGSQFYVLAGLNP